MHDAAVAVILALSAAVMFALLGTRAWLAITHRKAGQRLRAIVGIEHEGQRETVGGLIFDLTIAGLAEVLILLLLVDNWNRGPDGRFASAVAALEVGFAVAWILGLSRVTARVSSR
jgi:hypothetical protein